MLTFTNPNILIVEDDEPKLKAILALLNEIFSNPKIISAKSLSTALKSISQNQFDICIIDMSLPAYDFDKDITGGGQPQDFGGRDILRFLEDLAPNTKAVILTQYEEFKSKGFYGPEKLENIADELKIEFGGLLLDVIYYSGQRGNWREKIKSLITTKENSL